VSVGVLPQSITPDPSFRKKIEQRSGEKVSTCFQCEKCTNGCPASFAMDIPPHKVIRSIHLGSKGKVLHSDTIWVCASCETCTTRCPNGIDIAHVMDTLRQECRSEGIEASQKNVPLFHDVFLGSMKRHGRVHEPVMAATFALKSGGLSGLFSQSSMGLALFKKGKIKLLPSRLRAPREVKNFFNTAKRKGKS
jgi:heterodisulfide reductase subunit C